MKYVTGLINLIFSLVISTIIIYAINIVAGFAGADYSFTNGEVFVIWILMAILVNNCFNLELDCKKAGRTNNRTPIIYTTGIS